MAIKQSNQKTMERRSKSQTESRAKETTEYRRSAVKTKNKDVQAQEEKRIYKKQRKPKRVRIFPLWLRVIIIGILSIAALVAGLMIGYGVIGEGSPLDALKVETWRHIIDIVVSNE